MVACSCLEIYVEIGAEKSGRSFSSRNHSLLKKKKFKSIFPDPLARSRGIYREFFLGSELCILCAALQFRQTIHFVCSSKIRNVPSSTDFHIELPAAVTTGVFCKRVQTDYSHTPTITLNMAVRMCVVSLARTVARSDNSTLRLVENWFRIVGKSFSENKPQYQRLLLISSIRLPNAPSVVEDSFQTSLFELAIQVHVLGILFHFECFSQSIITPLPLYLTRKVEARKSE